MRKCALFLEKKQIDFFNKILKLFSLSCIIKM